MRQYFFRIGTILVIISFLICVYNFYALYYLSILFLLGVILILFSEVTLKQKIILTIAPVLLYVPMTIAWLWIYNYSPTKMIRIPEKHTGKFRIFYEEPCGDTYSLVNDMKTITIDIQSIAIIKDKFDGSRNFCYQFIEQAGKDIPYITNIADTADYDIAIISGASGVQYISTSINPSNNHVNGFRYTDFYLYRKDKNNNDWDERIDSLSESIVNNCRNSYTQKHEY